jgi:hypothetical protein
LHLVAETCVSFDPVVAVGSFPIATLPDATRLTIRTSFHALAVDSQRPSVGGELFDIEDSQTVCLKDPLGREQHELRKVLVINGVELALLDELQQVRKLHGDHAVPGRTETEVPDFRLEARRAEAAEG